MKPIYLHIPNCTFDEVDALRSLVGRRMAITEAPIESGRLSDVPAESSPIVRAVNPLPANPEHGEGTLVVVELWADLATDSAPS